jgi:hypothetical protein
MSFQNKDLDISFDDYDVMSSQNYTGKKINGLELYEDCPDSSKQLPNSLQEFLFQSDQIQLDIKKLTELSPEKASLFKEINEKIKRLGYKITVGQDSKANTLLELLGEVLSDFLYTTAKLEDQERTLIEINDTSKLLDMEKRNKSIYKLFEYESIESKLENLFKEIMNRNFNKKNDDDHNIMSFIKYTEIQRDKLINKIQELNLQAEKSCIDLKDLETKNKELYSKLKKSNISIENNEKLKIIDQVCRDLSIKSIKELPDVIGKFQQVMVALPNVEKFISEVSEELLAEQSSKKLDDIIPKIRAHKKLIVEAEDFKKRVSQAHGTEKLKDIIAYGKGFSHFCKLFEVTNTDKVISVVEELFYFVHQIKGFLSVNFI